MNRTIVIRANCFVDFFDFLFLPWLRIFNYTNIPGELGDSSRDQGWRGGKSLDDLYFFSSDYFFFLKTGGLNWEGQTYKY